MTARPMSPAREAALAVLKELVRGVAVAPGYSWPYLHAVVLGLIEATLADSAAINAARALVNFETETITITVGSRSYTIRTVDDLRTYLEREVPEPGR